MPFKVVQSIAKKSPLDANFFKFFRCGKSFQTASKRFENNGNNEMNSLHEKIAETSLNKLYYALYEKLHWQMNSKTKWDLIKILNTTATHQNENIIRAELRNMGKSF